MKSTGIVRKVDDLGRVVIPKELRKTMEIADGDPLEIYVEGETIILKQYKPYCVFCGECNDIVTYKGKHICKSCLAEIRST